MSSTQDSIESFAALPEADLDDEQIRALLSPPRHLPEREDDHKFITPKEKVCCQVHLKI